MKAMEHITVLDSLRGNYGALSIAERKIADFILNHPERAVSCNVSELANASGTSDATIIRFCKHAGYSGYYQLRIMLSRELGRIESAQDAEQEQNTAAGMLQKYASDIASIAHHIDEKTIRSCARALEKCHYAHIIAAGNTTPLAQYTGFRLGRLGVRATYHELAEYYLNDLVMADDNDVVLAISQSGASKQVLKALELASARKITIIGIVGYQQSPVSRLADYLLPAVVPEQYFDYRKSHSHLYEMAVIDVLMEQITNDRKLQNLSTNMMMQEMLTSDSKL